MQISDERFISSEKQKKKDLSVYLCHLFFYSLFHTKTWVNDLLEHLNSFSICLCSINSFGENVTKYINKKQTKTISSPSLCQFDFHLLLYVESVVVKMLSTQGVHWKRKLTSINSFCG